MSLQYWALCDDLVDFKLLAGVRYLCFSIDIALNSGLYDGFLFYVIIYSPEV